MGLGVGDPFSFAASGTRPVWVDGCTIVADDAFVFNACPLPAGQASVGAGEGGRDAGTHPPASSFVLTAHLDPTWGGASSATRGNRDRRMARGGANTLSARFPAARR